MRRKQTKLENNLYELGYRLDHKTYVGKKSEKVQYYVYTKSNNMMKKVVYLDRERNHILEYGFIEPKYVEFNGNNVDDIVTTYSLLGEELQEIYDFEKQVAKDYVNVKDVSDFENPFVEESAFDD